MGPLLLKLLIGYLEAHPEQIVALLGEATKAGVNALKTHNETAK